MNENLGNYQPDICKSGTYHQAEIEQEVQGAQMAQQAAVLASWDSKATVPGRRRALQGDFNKYHILKPTFLFFVEGEIEQQSVTFQLFFI